MFIPHRIFTLTSPLKQPSAVDTTYILTSCCHCVLLSPRMAGKCRAPRRTFPLLRCLTFSVTSCPAGCLIHCLTGLLAYWFTVSLPHCLTDSRPHCLTGFTASLPHWLTDSSPYYPTGWLTHWLTGWLTAYCLIACMILGHWLPGWLIDSPSCSPLTDCHCPINLLADWFAASLSLLKD